jgi:acetyltransferase
MGGESVAAGVKVLTEARIPQFSYPDAACKTFGQMWSYAKRLDSLYEIPALSTSGTGGGEHLEAGRWIGRALQENRELLDEHESKKVVSAYGIPTVQTEVAKTAAEAGVWAEKIGFPAVVKLYSRTITHKTDVGGVKLHLQSRQEVEAAYLEVEESVRRIAGPGHFEGVTVQPMIKKSGYELILGSSIDPQFGPVLLFGAGGELVEVFQDRALALPPLNTHLARLLMEETKIFKALQGVRGKPGVDLERLAELLVQFSRLVAENPRIKECDINPLLASSERLIALDARIILHPRSVSDADLPRSAIRPYPIHYIGSAVLKGGITVSFRPIAPEHEPLVAHFHRELSEETVRQRYLKALSYEERIAHERLVKICFNDYDREIALIAQVGEEIVGIARLSKGADRREAVFALIVKDKWQNRGIGKELLRRLLAIAQEEKIDTIFAHMLPENGQMRALCEHHHFELHEANGLIVGQWRRPNDRKMYF